MEKCHFESFQVFPCLAYVASVSVRFRSKEQGKRVKMTKVKEFGGGGEERKETLADKARILKTAHLACHAWVRALAFDGVISCQNWPIKCLAFRGVEMNFRGHVCENRIFFFAFWYAWMVLMLKSQWIRKINAGFVHLSYQSV